MTTEFRFWVDSIRSGEIHPLETKVRLNQTSRLRARVWRRRHLAANSPSGGHAEPFASGASLLAIDALGSTRVSTAQIACRHAIEIGQDPLLFPVSCMLRHNTASRHRIVQHRAAWYGVDVAPPRLPRRRPGARR